MKERTSVTNPRVTLDGTNRDLQTARFVVIGTITIETSRTQRHCLKHQQLFRPLPNYRSHERQAMIRFQINIEISPSDGSDFIRLTTERGAVISDGYAGAVGPATTAEGSGVRGAGDDGRGEEGEMSTQDGIVCRK